MATINVLDTQTANLIAAGEVVERPANVVKELLENAIDAGGTVIASEIEGGGIDRICITDNGKGMEEDDLPLSIRRHATSKIRTERDLTGITTLGFRGEALAAISSVSRFTLLSKRKSDAVGHQMTVEGETVLSLEECGCADGTSVIVRDLFFNQPARKKFLKRPQTEAAAILQYLQRIAVSHPEIAFRHTSDGQVKLQTSGSGKLYDCIYAVYGAAFAKGLVAVEEKSELFTIRGYITRPEFPRATHGDQSFYINSRLVKSRTMQFALEDAYKSFVKSEKFPGCVLFLDLDPARVDVNVHPAKLEVRFEDERMVYNALYSAVRKTLAGLSNELAVNAYQKAVEQKKSDPAFPVPPIHETSPRPAPSKEIAHAGFSQPSADLPFFAAAPIRGQKKKTTSGAGKDPVIEKPIIIERVAPDFADPDEKTAADDSKETPKQTGAPEEQLFLDAFAPKAETEVKSEGEPNPFAGFGKLVGAAFDAFLFYETKDRLFVIDKHAAHERILYEKLKKSHAQAGCQMLLTPIVLTLPPLHAATLSAYLTELGEAGFLMEEFGDDAFLVRGIPLELTGLGQDAIAAILEKSAEELALGGRAGGAGEKLFDRTLYSMACKAAVKAGIPSTENDHQWLIEELVHIDNVTVCPHGRPVLVSFSKKEIEGWFLRT